METGADRRVSTRVELPQSWLAIVRDPQGKPVGMGVLVKPRHVVTCAHVVSRALGLSDGSPPPEGAIVSIKTLSTLQEANAKVLLWRPPGDNFQDRHQDISYLELADASLPLASWDDLTAHGPGFESKVRVFGYPNRTPPGRLSFAHWLAGAVEGGWWQVNPPDNALASHVAIDPGFSGSLAWDMAEDKAVGIIVTQDGSSSFLIPCALLRDACTPEWPSGAAGLEGQPNAAANAAGTLSAGGVPDVFLCHNSRDKPLVRQLAEALDRRGLHAWLDERELRPGLPWQEELEKAIETSCR